MKDRHDMTLLRMHTLDTMPVLLLSIAVFAALSPASAADRAATPRIEFEKTRFDFGEVDEGARLVHRFRFRNAGTGELRVGPISSDTSGPFPGYSKAFQISAPTAGEGPIIPVQPGQWN